MRKYEAMLIFDSASSSDSVKDFVKKVLSENHSKILSEESIGIKKMAYPIDKKDRGFYYLLEFETEPSCIDKIKKDFNFKEEIVRYMFNHLDEPNEL